MKQVQEFFDVVDAQRNLLGKTCIRGTQLQKGEYHLVTAVWVINHEGKLLITKRSHNKETFPDLWENTSGYVQAGETTESAALRELFEETGLIASCEDICLIGTTTRGHTIADTYVFECTIPFVLSEIILQTDETQDAKLIYADEIEEMINADLFAEPVVFRLKSIVKPLNAILKKYTNKIFMI